MPLPVDGAKEIDLDVPSVDGSKGDFNHPYVFGVDPVSATAFWC